MSDDLISRRALYEKAATLEAQALDYVGKLIERDGDGTSVEWKIWSAILTERTAFKHDVYDAPSAQPDMSEYSDKLWRNAYERGKKDAQRTGRWKVSDLPKGKMKYCSECGFGQYIADERQYGYCPNCGARMVEEGQDEQS